MNPPKVAVIVLNWNNALDTIDCLKSVYLSENVSFTVWVVDNGSQDHSLNQIKKAFPQARYVEHQENLGFAEGNNRALKIAYEQGYDFFFLLNNDATIRSNTLSILQREALLHPEAGVLGPMIYYHDEPNRIWYGGGGWSFEMATFYHLRANEIEENFSVNKVEETEYVCGCAFFVKREVIEKVGLMDKRFFLNWEEVDWCWRMRAQNFKCLVITEAKTWHKVSQSFIGGKSGPMWLYFYWRNRLLWMEKNLLKKDFLKLFFTVIIPSLPRLCKNTPHAKASLIGIWDYLRRNFGPGPKSLVKK